MVVGPISDKGQQSNLVYCPVVENIQIWLQSLNLNVSPVRISCRCRYAKTDKKKLQYRDSSVDSNLSTCGRRTRPASPRAKSQPTKWCSPTSTTFQESFWKYFCSLGHDIHSNYPKYRSQVPIRGQLQGQDDLLLLLPLHDRSHPETGGPGKIWRSLNFRVD